MYDLVVQSPAPRTPAWNIHPPRLSRRWLDPFCPTDDGQRAAEEGMGPPTRKAEAPLFAKGRGPHPAGGRVVLPARPALEGLAAEDEGASGHRRQPFFWHFPWQ